MIFITGGTGLVGSHILLKLSQRNISFKALKRERSSLDVCKDVFTYYNAESQFNKIKWVNGDVNDIPSLENAMEECSRVLHCAAIVSFHPAEVELMRKVNIEGTANVANVALSKGIKKLGYVSSVAALGRNSTVGIVDEVTTRVHSAEDLEMAIKASSILFGNESFLVQPLDNICCGMNQLMN